MKLEQPICLRALLFSITLLVGVVFYQAIQISLLNANRAKHGAGEMLEARYRRSAAIEYSVGDPPEPMVDTNNAGDDMQDMLYFPIYTQLASKVLRDICHQKYGLGGGESTKEDSDANRTFLRKTGASRSGNKQRAHGKKAFKERVCAPIVGLGSARQVGSRVHDRGQALRHGRQWLLTELEFGSTVFQFDDRTLNASDALDEFSTPSSIHTLSEPFQGTNNAFAITAMIGHRQNNLEDNKSTELIFYYDTFTELEDTVRIQALYLSSGRRVTRLMSASKSPLYRHGGSSSAVDLEVDQTALWAIYRRPGHTHLTVSKMSTRSLKELAHFQLESIEPASSRLVNAFVSCGVLYGVEQEESEISIRALFDLRSGHVNSARDLGTAVLQRVVSSVGHTSLSSVQSVQHDPVSNSLSVFYRGTIFSIPLERKLS